MSNSASSAPSVLEAPIAHVDLDAFFASVEVLDDPTLRAKPVAVGGAGARGVIASASYEARRYGVRSAMPSVAAKRLCPSLIILPGRFDRYEEYSRRFQELVRDLTPEVEAIGLDEVFCDLRSLRLLNVNPLEATQRLRQRVSDELKLRCGIGLGRNKLFAKLASRRAKPRVENGQLVEGPGVLWVSPELEALWLEELEVRALWGVGPATAAKLDQLGLRFVRDLARVSENDLVRRFGSSLGTMLAAYAQGEDPREVVSDRVNKSIGHDQTFAVSLQTRDELTSMAERHAAVVARALRAQAQVARTITMIVRFDDLTSVSRSQTLAFGVDDEAAIAAVGEALLASINLPLAVRLLGLHVSGLRERDDNQLQLSFGLAGESNDHRVAAIERSRAHQVNNEALRDAIDEVRQRFGSSAVSNARDLTEGGIDVAKQRGSHAFGPESTSEP
ncbi:MAG TPA: DNA polymerase IV [Acidimicrobiales bacterium]|nr:DNA polymerase IV [Acidimicrobiales bacterium]